MASKALGEDLPAASSGDAGLTSARKPVISSGGEVHPVRPESTEVRLRREVDGSVVVVLGMHRSGTSLCSNILHTLGVEMCTDPKPGAHDNAKVAACRR